MPGAGHVTARPWILNDGVCLRSPYPDDHDRKTDQRNRSHQRGTDLLPRHRQSLQMSHALKQNQVKKTCGRREIVGTEPGFYHEPQQKHSQRQQTEIESDGRAMSSGRANKGTVKAGPKKKRQNQSILDALCLMKPSQGAIVLVVLEFYSFVKLLHDGITVFEFRQRTLPYKISSARVQAARSTW